MTSENTIVGLALCLLLVLFGQEQSRPGVLVVGKPDPEDVILVVEKFSLPDPLVNWPQLVRHLLAIDDFR